MFPGRKITEGAVSFRAVPTDEDGTFEMSWVHIYFRIRKNIKTYRLPKLLLGPLSELERLPKPLLGCP